MSDRIPMTRVGYDKTKAGKQAALVKVRSDRHSIEEDLDAMEKEQSKIKATLLGAQTANAGTLPAGCLEGRN